MKRLRLIRANRSPINRLLIGETGMWFATAVACVAALMQLFRSEQSAGAETATLIPAMSQIAVATRSTAQTDSAFALLAREWETEAPKAPIAQQPRLPSDLLPGMPQPANSVPTLRGIVWTPAVGVVIEGGGMPDGGGLLALNVPRGELKLTAVHGDTAFVRGRDTSWVLLLRSRNPQPQ